MVLIQCCTFKGDNKKSDAQVVYGGAVEEIVPIAGIPDNLGVWVSGQNATSFKINVAKNLNTNVVRHVINLATFTGTDKVYNEYTDSGLFIALTVANRAFSDAPKPFRKDTAEFREELENLLNRLPAMPLYVALDNEENNVSYYTGSRLDYIPLLKIAVDVCHQYGVPCTNGGFASYGSRIWAQQKRESRAVLTLHPRRIDTLLQAYRNIPIDWLNVHIYSKNLSQAEKAGDDFKEFIIQSGGMLVMSNETGILTNDSYIADMHLTSIMPVVESAIWFSGTKSDNVCVHDENSGLSDVGMVVKNY